MNAQTMMDTAAALFALAAIGGLIMAVIRFKGANRPPSWLAMAHGLLAAAAFTLLIYAAATAEVPGIAVAALIILVIVAIVGVAKPAGWHRDLSLGNALLIDLGRSSVLWQCIGGYVRTDLRPSWGSIGLQVCINSQGDST